jgi:hypothetical protein
MVIVDRRRFEDIGSPSGISRDDRFCATLSRSG